MSDTRFVLIAALLGGLAGAAVTLGVERLVVAPPPQPVATVDIGALVRQQVKRLEAEDYSERDIRRYARDWGRRLETAVDAMAREHGTTVVVSEAVVSGAPDLTETLYRRVMAGDAGPGQDDGGNDAGPVR